MNSSLFDRKGIFMASFLVKTVFTIMAVFVVFAFANRLYAGITGGAENKAALDNFKLLTASLEGFLESEEDFGSTSMILSLQKEYDIIGFDFDLAEDTTFCMKSGEEDINYPKPVECEEQKSGNRGIFQRQEETLEEGGCLCLFKNEKALTCQSFEKAKFFRSYTGFIGFEKPGFPDIEGVDNKYSSLCLFGSHPQLDILWKAKNVYIEFLKEGETNNLFIAPYNDDVKKRYKFVNKCSGDSNVSCIDKHHDYVFIENNKQFVCKFNEEENICYTEPIEDCKNGFIQEECDCGGVAYDSGACIEEQFFVEQPNFCQINNIGEDSSCGEYLQDKECVLNVCHIEETCYWGKGGILGGLSVNACRTCEEECKCDIYDDDWVKEINPCNCADCS